MAVLKVHWKETSTATLDVELVSKVDNHASHVKGKHNLSGVFVDGQCTTSIVLP